MAKDANSVIKKYLADMHALETHGLQAVSRQAEQLKDAKHPDALRAVQGFRTTLAGHVAALDQRLKTLGGSADRPVQDTVAAMAGVVAGIYNAVRSEEASKSIRDDYTFFSHSAIAYLMLHTTTEALGTRSRRPWPRQITETWHAWSWKLIVLCLAWSSPNCSRMGCRLAISKPTVSNWSATPGTLARRVRPAALAPKEKPRWDLHLVITHISAGRAGEAPSDVVPWKCRETKGQRRRSHGQDSGCVGDCQPARSGVGGRAGGVFGAGSGGVAGRARRRRRRPCGCWCRRCRGLWEVNRRW